MFGDLWVKSVEEEFIAIEEGRPVVDGVCNVGVATDVVDPNTQSSLITSFFANSRAKYRF